MVSACRTAAEALGKVTYERQSSEIEIKLRRSLYAVADIAAGEPFSKKTSGPKARIRIATQ